MFQVLHRLMRLMGSGRLDHQDRLLALTLNNMTQGVVMFNASGRLVVFNDQYRTMYGLSADIVKPGATLIDIVRHRAKAGSLNRDPDQYCADLLSAMAAGKVVSFVTEAADGRAVSVVNRAIPGSNYWVGTHDDITERRSAERKNLLLSEQEARRAAIEEAIAWFRESVEGVLKTVADNVSAMKSTATVLSATSNETTAHTVGAVDTSNEAFGSVQVAATAADELSKSIAEINRQLVRASDVVRAAATEAQSTNEDIAGLAQAAQKIDDVVKLIQSVAGQTNLLGAQRHDRGGARRRGRQGLCRRRLRSQGACRANRQGNGRHRRSNLRGAIVHAKRGWRHRQHCPPHAGGPAIHCRHRHVGRTAERGNEGDLQQRRSGRLGHEIGRFSVATCLRRDC